jgi:putrescine importer
VTDPEITLPAPEAEQQPHLRRVLGLSAIVIFGVAYMVPMTVFSTLGPVQEITQNHLPGAYVLTLIAMLFTAASYGHMARKYPVAGSAYTYAQRSFGGGVGFLTGWALLLDYILLPLINYMLVGLYLNAAFPAVPSWVFLIAALALVTGLNVTGINSVNKVNAILVASQFIFCVVFVAMSLRTVAGDGGTPSPMDGIFGNGAEFGTLMTGAAILCLSFLGFDAVSTLSEEAKEPRKNIPRGIFLVTLVGGLTFIALSLVAFLVVPDFKDFTDIATGSAEVVDKAGGAWLSNLFTAAYVAGGIGSALASQASVSRILYTMGRDGVLPRSVFGVLSPKTETPVRATLVVAAVSLLGLVLDLDFVISIISFGALAGFTLVNLSVIKSHFFDDGHRAPADLLKFLIMPAIGFAVTAWLWTSLPRDAILIGLIWTAVGVAQLAYITGGFRHKPPQMDLQETV